MPCMSGKNWRRWGWESIKWPNARRFALYKKCIIKLSSNNTYYYLLRLRAVLPHPAWLTASLRDSSVGKSLLPLLSLGAQSRKSSSMSSRQATGPLLMFSGIAWMFLISPGVKPKFAAMRFHLLAHGFSCWQRPTQCSFWSRTVLLVWRPTYKKVKFMWWRHC